MKNLQTINIEVLIQALSEPGNTSNSSVVTFYNAEAERQGWNPIDKEIVRRHKPLLFSLLRDFMNSATYKAPTSSVINLTIGSLIGQLEIKAEDGLLNTEDLETQISESLTKIVTQLEDSANEETAVLKMSYQSTPQS